MSDVNFIYVHCAVVDGMLGVIVCVSLSVFRSEIEEGNTRCLLACPTQFTSNSQFSKFVLKNNISVVIGIHAYKSGRFMKGKPTSLLYFSRLLLLPTYLVYDLSNFSRLLISPTVLAYFSRLLLCLHISPIISPTSLAFLYRLLLFSTSLVYFSCLHISSITSPTSLAFLYRLLCSPIYIAYFSCLHISSIISPTSLPFLYRLLCSPTSLAFFARYFCSRDIAFFFFLLDQLLRLQPK